MMVSYIVSNYETAEIGAEFKGVITKAQKTYDQAKNKTGSIHNATDFFLSTVEEVRYISHELQNSNVSNF